MTTDMREIKRFVLRALLALEGAPMPDLALDTSIKDSVAPRPLQSDIVRAKRELEEQGWIIGTTDELDGSTSWVLTTKGSLKAKQL